MRRLDLVRTLYVTFYWGALLIRRSMLGKESSKDICSNQVKIGHIYFL